MEGGRGEASRKERLKRGNEERRFWPAVQGLRRVEKSGVCNAMINQLGTK